MAGRPLHPSARETEAQAAESSRAASAERRRESLPPASYGAPDGAIVVRGARVHNLKNVDFEIPHNRLTVVTGVSGSGKSSLAFDTIYAEGQRRYVESLSAYARQFLDRMEKPDVDEVSGIAPAVAIRQKNSTRNPRSTVATATEIYDYLRLLFARIGVTTCPRCDEVVRKDTVDDVARRVEALEAGRRFYVLFQLTPGRAADKKPERKKGARPAPRAPEPSAPQPPEDPLKARLESLRRQGFNRLYQLGRVFEFSTPESLLEIDFSRPVYVLVDRLAVAPDIRQRLIDSVELCFRESGEAVLEFVGGKAGEEPRAPERLVFSERFECRKCRTAFQEPEPRLFSFNNPFGACPRCQGFGNTIDFDLDLVIPDKNKSLAEGAIEPWTKPRYRGFANEMKRAARPRGIPLDTPYHRLTADQRRWLLDGDGDFTGIRGFFHYLDRKKYKLHVRVFLSRFRGYTLCPECQGGRLRREALHVRVGGATLTELCRWSIAEAYRFFNELKLAPHEQAVVEKVLEEIRSRLKYLYRVGLEYLTLDRLASTLSGGEAQRIQLATSLGSNLVGALYVLDEPSIGLHARDTGRLIDILKNLRDLGNTILVVEHDAEMMRNADKVLDLGPGAGENGGRIIYSGDFDGLARDPHSLTGRYLSGELEIPVPEERRKPGKAWLKVRGARQHNLKGIDVEIPLGLMVAVSGVSGSGKSTLVHDVLYNALVSRRGVRTSARAAGQENVAGHGGEDAEPAGPAPLHGEAVQGRPATRAEFEKIEGDAAIRDVVLVDQSPLGRTPRSNPVTYVKAFDAIREVFASTPQARKMGLAPGAFSFNIPGGRCETCQGAGTVTVEMQFLADVELVCEECRGKRFKPGILEIRHRGKNISDVLQMTVKEALAFFSSARKVTERLRVLDEVGLGYLRLGQSATTLSGGEAQRVRLAAHLAQRTGESALLLFDEPTTGLHFDDIAKLLAAFRKLVDAGSTVLVIEHNLDVLKAADWMIDLGPEGGDAGGLLVQAGPPEDFVKRPRGHTAKFLAAWLERRAAPAGSTKHPN